MTDDNPADPTYYFHCKNFASCGNNYFGDDLVTTMIDQKVLLKICARWTLKKYGGKEETIRAIKSKPYWHCSQFLRGLTKKLPF